MFKLTVLAFLVSVQTVYAGANPTPAPTSASCGSVSSKSTARYIKEAVIMAEVAATLQVDTNGTDHCDWSSVTCIIVDDTCAVSEIRCTTENVHGSENNTFLSFLYESDAFWNCTAFVRNATIPASVGELASLKVLSATRYCKLAGTIPDTLVLLSSLSSLDLSQTDVSSRYPGDAKCFTAKC